MHKCRWLAEMRQQQQRRGITAAGRHALMLRSIKAGAQLHPAMAHGRASKGQGASMGTPHTSGFVQGRPEWLGHVQCAARAAVHETSEAPGGRRAALRTGHILCMASAGGKMRVAAAAAGAHSVQFISHHSSIGKCASGVPRPPRHGELAADCAPPASSPSTAASPGGSGTPTTPWCGAPVAAAAPSGSGSPGSTRSERRARKVSTHGWCSMSRVVGRSAGSLASAGVTWAGGRWCCRRPRMALVVAIGCTAPMAAHGLRRRTAATCAAAAAQRLRA